MLYGRICFPGVSVTGAVGLFINAVLIYESVLMQQKNIRETQPLCFELFMSLEALSPQLRALLPDLREGSSFWAVDECLSR